MTQNHPTRSCPFCRETIYANALVCRFCRRDIPLTRGPSQRARPSWLPLLFATAIAIGGAALLSCELRRERRYWDDKFTFLDNEES